jgi:hypothetical protein
MPFAKGQSGNPGGRPKALPEVQEAARAHTPVALGTLACIPDGAHTARRNFEAFDRNDTIDLGARRFAPAVRDHPPMDRA